MVTWGGALYTHYQSNCIDNHDIFESHPLVLLLWRPQNYCSVIGRPELSFKFICSSSSLHDHN